MTNHLLLMFIASMGFNLIMFIPAFLFKTDKLTDISYSLTFIFLSAYGLFSSDGSPYHIILLLMICAWAMRLGGYLLYRIHEMGRDKRFDEMRESFPRFLGFWLLQGLTVFIVMLPSFFFYNASSEWSYISAIGVLIFILGLVIESIADMQKLKDKNSGNSKWTDSGLWSLVRHPNYTGEIMVWLGVFLFCIPGLDLIGIFVGSLSPLFIFIMLRFVSGVPLIEKSQRNRWGEDPEFIRYKSRTGMFIPKLRKS